jgi:four helix bundle protein
LEEAAKSFEQLRVWQTAQDMAVMVYRFTKDFPDYEKFGLINQVRRSASSVSANIAEGFGRRSAKDKLQFYYVAHGSLLETKNFVLLSVKLNFLDKNIANDVLQTITQCQKQLNAYIGAINK